MPAILRIYNFKFNNKAGNRPSPTSLRGGASLGKARLEDAATFHLAEAPGVGRPPKEGTFLLFTFYFLLSYSPFPKKYLFASEPTNQR